MQPCYDNFNRSREFMSLGYDCDVVICECSVEAIRKRFFTSFLRYKCMYVVWFRIFRPPDIHVGGLMFYTDSFFFLRSSSIFFFSSSNLRAR